jgi:hypothetical protein
VTFGVKSVTDLTRSATFLTQTAAIFAGAQPVLEEEKSGGRQFSRNRRMFHLAATRTVAFRPSLIPIIAVSSTALAAAN